MSALETVEAQVQSLPREQVLKPQEWLADYLGTRRNSIRRSSPASNSATLT